MRTMAHIKNTKQLQLDHICEELESGIDQTYKGEVLPINRFQDLRFHVHHYLTIAGEHIESNKSKEKILGFLVLPCQEAASKLYEKMSQYLRNYVESLSNEATDKNDEELLEFFSHKWEKYQDSTETWNSICSALNHHWVRQQPRLARRNVYDIYLLAYNTWRDCLSKELNQRVLIATLKIIEKERNGGFINRQAVASVVNSFIVLGITDLSLYLENFEENFLEYTERYYTEKSSKLLGKLSINEYMKKVERILKKEKRKVALNLHYNTIEKLVKMCEKILIQDHIQTFKDEFQELLKNQENEALERMYSLIGRIPDGYKNFESIVEEHINEQGQEAIKAASYNNDPKMYVDAIRSVYNKYNEVVLRAFKNNSKFLAALDNACMRFINVNTVTKAANSSTVSPELIAKYCDFLQRKGTKTCELAEIEYTFDQVMIVFKYLHDKDMFGNFYRHFLAKRLVHHLSASNEVEALMISKMKIACGYEYTAVMETMIKDIISSNNLNAKFGEHLLQSKKPLNICFSIQVLSANSWSWKQSQDFDLPIELEKYIHEFILFYATAESRRKLQWVHSISRCELVTSCFKNNYIIQANVYQIAILLQFNNSDTLTIANLAENTKLKPEYLIRVVKTLLKANLLKCDDKELTESSVIHLFLGYKNKKLKVNIDIPIKSDTKKEEETTHVHVENERKFKLDAAIVRIMKTRRVLKHNTLIEEVIDHIKVHFVPNVKSIESRISLLLEKDYIKHSDEESDTYKYVE